MFGKSRIGKKPVAVKDTSVSTEAYAKARAKKKTVPEAPAMTPIKGMEDHEARYDLETLTRAHQVRKDRGRHKAAMKHAKHQQRTLAEVMKKA